MERIEKEVLEKVVTFMKENRISCEETVYQADRVITNAYDFIADLFKSVEPLLELEEEED